MNSCRTVLQIVAAALTALPLFATAACQDTAQPNVDWRSCVKRNEVLIGVPLVNASLENVNFEMANLAGANLEGARLSAATLNYANLQRANLQRADLWRASMRGVILDGALLSGATWIDGRVCGPSSVGVCR